MTDKFTPGPWEVIPNANDPPDAFFVRYRPRASRWRSIVIVSGNGYQKAGEAESNANLIAAAPDLLAALESVEWVSKVDEYGDEYEECPSCGAVEGGMGGAHFDNCPRQAAIAKARGEQ